MIKRKQIITLTAIIFGSLTAGWVYFRMTGKNVYIKLFVFGLVFFIVRELIEYQKRN